MKRLCAGVLVVSVFLMAASQARALRVETIEVEVQVSDTEALREQKRRLRSVQSCWKEMHTTLESSAYRDGSTLERTRILKRELDRLTLCHNRGGGLSRVLATSMDEEEMRFWLRLSNVHLKPVPDQTPRESDPGDPKDQAGKTSPDSPSNQQNKKPSRQNGDGSKTIPKQDADTERQQGNTDG